MTFNAFNPIPVDVTKVALSECEQWALLYIPKFGATHLMLLGRDAERAQMYITMTLQERQSQGEAVFSGNSSWSAIWHTSDGERVVDAYTLICAPLEVTV